MKLLLDTHALLWRLADSPRLGSEARARIADPASLVFVSAASVWEIAVKREAGRLVAPGDVSSWIDDNGFLPLSIDVEHAIAAAELPAHHRDPFDRLLVAQARIESLTLVAQDTEIARYDVSLIDAGR